MLPIGDEDRDRRAVPVVTFGLIALNVVVFLVELSGGDAFINQWAFVPARFLANPATQFITIFSAMFMHASWLHLGGNMLYLWIFGDNVEDNYGAVKFLIFYLLCGVGATSLQLAFSANSTIPNLGASGAIAGVLGAYLIMFPGRPVRVLAGNYVTQMSALAVIGIWFLLQLFNGVGAITETSADQGGVAYMAHVGGFVTGFVLSFVFRDSSRLRLRG